MGRKRKKEKEWETVGVSISPDLFERLEFFAKASVGNRSEIIRFLIEHYLPDPTREEEEAKKFIMEFINWKWELAKKQKEEKEKNGKEIKPKIILPNEDEKVNNG